MAIIPEELLADLKPILFTSYKPAPLGYKSPWLKVHQKPVTHQVCQAFVVCKLLQRQNQDHREIQMFSPQLQREIARLAFERSICSLNIAWHVKAISHV